MDAGYIFDHANEFLTLSSLRNFSEAADSLYISQSSLSKHILKMESLLGAPLFDRTTRAVQLSDYGQQLLPLFRKMEEARNELEKAILFQNRHTNKIIVNAIPQLDIYQIPSKISSFQKEHPDCFVTVRESYESTNPIHELENGNCDIALYRSHMPHSEKLAEIQYATDHMVAILSVNHRYAHLDSISLSSLNNDDFALIHHTTSIYRLCIEACRLAGFEPRVLYNSHRIESIVNMAEQNMAVALLTRKQAELVWKPSLSIVELQPEISTGISLYYHRDTLSEIVKFFIDYLCNTTV